MNMVITQKGTKEGEGKKKKRKVNSFANKNQKTGSEKRCFTYLEYYAAALLCGASRCLIRVC